MDIQYPTDFLGVFLDICYSFLDIQNRIMDIQ